MSLICIGIAITEELGRKVLIMNVLIIEDNEQDQKILTRYLSKSGVKEITVAENGEDGVVKAAGASFDLILVDTMLPGMDGFATCRSIKEQGGRAQVIMMTGRVDAVDADKARQMGADDYCVKTSDCAELLSALERLCPGSANERKLADSPAGKEGEEEIYSEWGLEKTNQAIKALYRELEKKNEELTELDKLKSEFVSTVSHELRTPLTVIKLSISQILDGVYGDLNPEQKEKLSMAIRGTDLLRRIINDLLDIAKLESKKVSLKMNDFNLTDLAKDVYHSFAQLAKEKGLGLRLECSGEEIMVNADRDRIMQVFTNLLGNAFKFTEKGSIQINIEDKGEAVECSVADTGRGIAADDCPKAFDRFQQFGKSFEPGQEGTGLGLSICQGIVELHQGTIYLTSTLGEGTTIVFTLPKPS